MNRDEELGHRKPLPLQRRRHLRPVVPRKRRVWLGGLLPTGEYRKLKQVVLCRPGLGSGRPGPCERCWSRMAVDAHHRLMTAHGGPDAAANLAALCRECHDWCHAHPEKAQLAGWLVPSHADFRNRALLLGNGMIVTLDDEGGYSFQAELEPG